MAGKKALPITLALSACFWQPSRSITYESHIRFASSATSVSWPQSSTHLDTSLVMSTCEISPHVCQTNVGRDSAVARNHRASSQLPVTKSASKVELELASSKALLVNHARFACLFPTN